MKNHFNPFFALLLLLLSCSAAFSQTTGYSGTGVNIDVIYTKCDWKIDPAATKNIAGTITIQFTTRQANVSTINFDLRKSSFNNASLDVKYLGSSVPFSFPSTGNVNILNITLPSALANNTTASVDISYSGTPPAVSGQAEGYQRKQDGAGNWYIYTLSESYEDRDWWPCKADMQDKIDQMDIWVSVPDGYRAATNGAFIDSSTVLAGFRTFKYQTKYPISSYLVALGIAKYKVLSVPPVIIGGVSVPIWYWVFPDKTAATYTNIQNTLDKSRAQLLNFSAKLGDYPFKNEKHGFYEFGWGGGMEHQSFSAMGGSTLTDWSTIAHELSHQWFGDKVSFATWNELWLAEGFARYCESLAIELDPSVSGSESPTTVRTAFKNAARSTTSPNTTNSMSKTEVYIPMASIANSNALWSSTYGSTVYEKGAMIISMLRKLVGDAQFFQALKNYLADPALAYKSATTTLLKNHFEAVCGYDLDPFFNDWVYGKGHADYTIRWNNSGKRIAIQVASQARSTGTTVSYFRTPVVVTITNGVIDTTVVIYDQNGSLSFAGKGIGAPQFQNTLSYNLSFTPTAVNYDVFAETMANGSVSQDVSLNPANFATLATKILDFKGVANASGNLLVLKMNTTTSNEKVQLERSTDGVHFTSLVLMEKAHQTGDQADYQFTDKEAFTQAIYYYRVKTQEGSEEAVYSKTISLGSNIKTSQPSLKPNPANDYIQLTIPADWQKEAVSFTLYDASATLIRTGSFEITSGNNHLDVSSLQAATYIIELTTTSGKRWSQKFLIAR